jgi:hypothetical protein
MWEPRQPKPAPLFESVDMTLKGAGADVTSQS